MDVLLWLGWFCALVVTLFTVWMLAAGTACARSPAWAAWMYTAGVDELRARGFGSPVCTSAEVQVINDVLGSEPEAVDPTTDARLVDAIRALTDATESDFDRLSQVRAELLAGAVAKQHAAVERIANPQIFVKIWNLRRTLSTIHAAAVGLRWFVPLFAVRTRRIGEKYLSTATLIGIWSGLLFWGFAQMHGGSALEGWVAIVSMIITLAGASGLVAAVGQQMYAVVTAWWGPPRQWPRKGVLSGLVAALVILCLLVLIGTGTLQRASVAAGTWLISKVEALGTTDAIGAVLMIAALVFLAYRSVRLTLATYLKTSERIAYGLLALLLISFTAPILAFLFHVPRPWATASLYACGLVVVCFSAYEMALVTIRWRRDFLFLKRKGVLVPRRGFRSWALLSWLAALAIVTITTSVTQVLGPSWSFSLTGQVTGILLMVLSVVMMLTFLPGAVVTGLYLWRVRRFATATRHRREALEMSSSPIR